VSKLRRKFLKFGDFTSSSGLKIWYYYNFRTFTVQVKEWKELIIKMSNFINELKSINPVRIVGIGSFGYNLTYAVSARLKDLSRFSLYNPHLNRITAGLPKDEINIYKDYIIIDDVITTGSTIINAIEYYETKPLHILCLVNRSNLIEIDGIPIKEFLKQGLIERFLKIIYWIKNKIKK